MLLKMTPDDFASIQQRLDQRALEQVAMLQRISGYLNLIKWGVGLIALLLFFCLLTISR